MTITGASLTTLNDILPETARPEEIQYLQTLPFKSLSELLETPSALSAHASTLSSSLANLAQSSYPSFLSLHSSSQTLSTSLDALSTSLNALLDDSLPALDNAANLFRSKVADGVTERVKARAVLKQKDTLKVMLEVPQLMETCIRNGMYDAALSLSAHVLSALPEEDKRQNALTISLRSAINSAHTSLRMTLLATLSNPAARLPALHKAATFLRRMEVLSEPELALALLQGRTHCIKIALDGVNREFSFDDSLRYLKRYIECWREGVSDLIAQYSAIFLSGEYKTETSKGPTPSTLFPPCLQQLLHRHLLPQVEFRLHLVPPNALQAILTQLTYLATAMARAGLGFHSLLGPIFAHAVRVQTTKALEAAGELWTREIIQLSLLPKDKDDEKSNSGFVYDYALAPHTPPTALSTPTSLARFANTLLTALNDLRSLAPMELKYTLLESLDSVLSQGARDLSGTKSAKWIGRKYVGVLVPYMRRALVEGVYGANVEERARWALKPDSELASCMKEWEEERL